MADLPNCPRGRTEEYLADMAGISDSAPDKPWSRKEAYLNAINEHVEDIEQEIEDLKNNPDVVDIVDTYANLQAYDTSKLTDKDVIRVLNDETHDGNSTYYRYNKATDAFTYIGSSKTYSAFVGTDGSEAGSEGLVPAPAVTDADKYLKSDGTWATVDAGPTVVQTIGKSTTDVMSQKAVSDTVFYNSGNTYTRENIRIGHTNMVGYQSTSIGYNQTFGNLAFSVAIGANSSAGNDGVVIVGNSAVANKPGAVAIGYGSSATTKGEMNIGTTSTGYGYASSNYRLLSGLYDPQSAHDAATKGYVDGKNLVFYMSVDPAVTASQVSVYSDASCTTPISLRTFFSALRDGKSVCLQYRDGSGEEDHLSSFQIVTSRLTNVDTEDAYNEVSPYAIYYVGSGWKRIGADAVDPDATTGAFNIASQS